MHSSWKARWLLGDIFIILNKLFKFDLKAVLRILMDENADSLDDFFWDDPFVFLGEVLAYFKNTILKGSTNPSEEGMIG